jgi:hypothetical protein
LCALRTNVHILNSTARRECPFGIVRKGYATVLSGDVLAALRSRQRRSRSRPRSPVPLPSRPCPVSRSPCPGPERPATGPCPAPIARNRPTCPDPTGLNQNRQQFAWQNLRRYPPAAGLPAPRRPSSSPRAVRPPRPAPLSAPARRVRLRRSRSACPAPAQRSAQLAPSGFGRKFAARRKLTGRPTTGFVPRSGDFPSR